MWKLIEVALAPPVINLPVVKFCFMSITTEVFAAMETAENNATESKASVKVPPEAAVLATTMFVTTAVVEAGTV